MGKILIVDDEAPLRSLLDRVFNKEGHTVFTAKDGKEGLRKFGEEEIDLALIDIKMPGQSGVALLNEMKKINPEREVIVMTGYGSLETAIEATRSGAFDYLRKPFERIEHVVEAVHRGLEKKRLSDENRRLLEATRKQRDELSLSKEYVESILNSVVDILFVVDTNGMIKTINQGALDLLGYGEAELIGQHINVLFSKEGEGEEMGAAIMSTLAVAKGQAEATAIRDSAGFHRLVREGRIQHCEMMYQAKSGEMIPVSFSGSLIHGPGGSLIGIVGIARDMRELKRLIQQEKNFIAAAADADKKRAAGLEKVNRDLAEKGKRLQRFQDITVDREMVMVALKKEINDLLANLGKPKRYEVPEKIKKR
jgi:FixJ family two-component response regulator